MFALMEMKQVTGESDAAGEANKFVLRLMHSLGKHNWTAEIEDLFRMCFRLCEYSRQRIEAMRCFCC